MVVINRVRNQLKPISMGKKCGKLGKSALYVHLTIVPLYLLIKVSGVRISDGSPEKRHFSTKKNVFFYLNLSYVKLNVLTHAKLLRS